MKRKTGKREKFIFLFEIFNKLITSKWIADTISAGFSSFSFTFRTPLLPKTTGKTENKRRLETTLVNALKTEAKANKSWSEKCKNTRHFARKGAETRRKLRKSCAVSSGLLNKQ